MTFSTGESTNDNVTRSPFPPKWARWRGRIALARMAVFMLSLLSSAAADDNLQNHIAVAVRLQPGQQVTIDGRLDESFWMSIPVANHFTQREPVDGVPATEDTEARFCYDEENLYVGVRCWDSHPDGIVNRLSYVERDMYSGDTIGLFMDPRHDHRTGVKFGTNPSGMRED